MHLERLEGDDVVGSENRRSQRPLWAALTALLVTGLAASLFLASQGVKSATATAAADAQLTVQDQLAPLLTPSDVARPVTSERYQTLSSQVSKRLLSAGPYDGVRLWGPDGTVLYDVERSAVGERAPGEQQRIRRVMQEGRESEVDGATFLTLVPLRLEVDGPFVGVAALAQPYAPLRSSGSSPWRTVAIGFAAALLPVLVMLLLTFPGIRRRVPQEFTRGGVTRGPQEAAATFADAGHRPDDAEAASAVSRRSMPAEGEPAGSDPGYREAVEARRKAEERASEALEIAERTRLELEETRAAATAAEEDDPARLRRELDEERAAMRTSEAERVALIDRLRETELQRASLAEQLAAASAGPAASGVAPADPTATQAIRAMEERALAAEQRLGIAEQRAVQAERQAAAATERTQALEAEALRQSDRVAEAERQTAQAREQLRSTHTELQQIATATEGTSAEYEAAVVAADTRARQAEGRAEAARIEIDELRARLAPAELELAHLREQLTTAERGRVELHDRIAVAEAEASDASDRAAQAEADAAARVLSLDTDMESRIAAIEAAANDRVAEAEARAAEATANANRAEDELQRAIVAWAGAAVPGAGQDEHEIRRILRVTQDRLQRATQRADAAERRAAASDELAARLERELERLRAKQEAAAAIPSPAPAVVAVPAPAAAGPWIDEAELRRQKLASALMSLHPQRAAQDEPSGEPEERADAESADETDEQHTTIVPDENMVQLRDLAKDTPADRGMQTSA